jgi:dipeptidyl aminopeptidase/acylaminoacyl peptidase
MRPTKPKTVLSPLLAAAFGLCLLSNSALAQRPKGAEEEKAHQAIAKAWQIFRGHTDAVRSVAFSPNSKLLASASDDKTVKLWDVGTGTERTTLRGHTDCVQSVTLSPDGKVVASASIDKTVRLWDAVGGKQLATLQHAEPVCSVAFSPDGKSLATGDEDGMVRLWDVAGRKERLILKAHAGQVWVVAFSPDGATLASGGDDFKVKLWDMPDGKERATLQGHFCFIRALSFSPDGKSLASASENSKVMLWETATGKRMPSIRGFGRAGHAVGFSPDGRSVATVGHENAILWELATGKQRAIIEEHANGVNSMAFSPDGKALALLNRHNNVFALWRVPISQNDELARSNHLTPEDLDGLWTTLADEDASKAYQAIGALVAAPEQAVSVAKKHLRPASIPNPEVVNRWIADLDSNTFAVRQKANSELAKMGEQAGPSLRQGLAGKPSPEVRQRLERLLSDIERPSTESIRDLRAFEALELIGNTEAKNLLEALAGGTEGFRLTKEAKSTLARLNKRVATDK